MQLSSERAVLELATTCKLTSAQIRRIHKPQIRQDMAGAMWQTKVNLASINQLRVHSRVTSCAMQQLAYHPSRLTRPVERRYRVKATYYACNSPCGEHLKHTEYYSNRCKAVREFLFYFQLLSYIDLNQIYLQLGTTTMNHFQPHFAFSSTLGCRWNWRRVSGQTLV